MIEQNNVIKQHGRIEQRQTGFVAVRIRTIAGNLTSSQLRKVADLCDKYGRGQLHITTRQSVEIHWVQEHRLNILLQEIHDLGLLLAVRGPRVLTVIACPGRGLCQRGISDTVLLAAQLNELMVGHELPGKTKIALSGCPNSCAKPQISDIGLHGVTIPAVAAGCAGCNSCVQGCKAEAIKVQQYVPHIDSNKCVGCGICIKNCPQQAVVARRRGYAVYVGGKIGRTPMLGTKILSAIPEQEAVFYIQAILDVYNRLSFKGERIGTAIKRIGVETFRQEILTQTEPL
ncbi:4Fe-4S dicluster domain-containing protein [Sporomusa termitida]|uniref:Anaerobic sulfite reductase subunit C n=1 Tax=Sporomusa termitida TaxID=2377 RepID=A0A517DPA6_9FIRM|nr:4Fe-4S dicluster domain-containing protein [Sporomusa termitida]QDR79195.1 Anaerobic sulfite reductase subunit C [Sporomusa termitida]